MSSTCLIAAHDPWFIQLLRVYSEEYGFGIVQAFESQDVLASVQENRLDVILMQYDLPGLFNRQNLIKALKSRETSANIPIIIFSWQSRTEEILDGVLALLQEPISFSAFTQALIKANVITERSGIVENGGDGLLARSRRGRK